MPGMLTLKDLQNAVGGGEIDAVIVSFPDTQGRLVGKRFQAEYFLDGAHDETHGCDYLLPNDIDMEPVPGYAAANWEKGYGDFVMKPDLTTLRRIPWLPATALVLCDVVFVAGQLAYAREITWFLAPYVNSYKGFQAGTFAPTKAICSLDNRTAGFRLCGADSEAIRIECRMGGADLNRR
jgi:glutamine synthetase